MSKAITKTKIKASDKKRFIAVTAALLIAAAVLPLISGCWDLRELDTITIVTGIGLDAAPDGEVEVVLQCGKAQSTAAPSSSGGGSSGSQKAFTIISEKSVNIALALSKIRAKSPRLPFLQHAQVLVIGRELAERGIKDYLDIFLRMDEMRLEMMCVVTDGTAREVLEKELPPEKQSAIGLARLIQNSDSVSHKLNIPLLQFIAITEEKHSASFMPHIKMIEENQESAAVYQGFTLFSGGKLVGEMDMNKVLGYLWTIGDVKERAIEVFTGEGSCALGVLKVDAKKQVKDSGGAPEIDLMVKTKLDIKEIHGFDDKTLDEIISDLEQKAAEAIEQEIADLFTYLQEVNADMMRLGELVHKKSPALWHDIEEEWNTKYFKELKINIKAEVTVDDNGKINEALRMEKRGAHTEK